MWDLPGPGLEPVSPALGGEFLTTAPPGKPWSESLFIPMTFICFLATGFLYGILHATPMCVGADGSTGVLVAEDEVHGRGSQSLLQDPVVSWWTPRFHAQFSNYHVIIIPPQLLELFFSAYLTCGILSMWKVKWPAFHLSPIFKRNICFWSMRSSHILGKNTIKSGDSLPVNLFLSIFRSGSNCVTLRNLLPLSES